MTDRLLDGVRVLDLTGGEADRVGRLLADLGADVLKVEPPGGNPEREALPTLAGVSLSFAVHNANKRSTVLNPLDENDRRRFLELARFATRAPTWQHAPHAPFSSLPLRHDRLFARNRRAPA